MSEVVANVGSNNDWWCELGLRVADDRRVNGTAASVLREYVPVGFVPVDGGEVVGLHQVAAEIKTAEREVEVRKQRAKAQRLAENEAAFEAAFTLPDADALVSQGRWAGFTRGEAIAWCWNLFEFEPRGFVHPGSQVRMEAMQQLRDGGLPEVFGYPERARQLADTGMSARAYRRHHDALGTRKFDESDVRHRGIRH